MSKGRWNIQSEKNNKIQCDQLLKWTLATGMAVMLLMLVVASSAALLYLLTTNSGEKIGTQDCCVVSHNTDAECKQNVCETKACKATARQFMSNINSSVQACDNFYQFACSGYMQSPKERQMTVLDELDEQVNEQLTRVLVEISRSAETQPKPYRDLAQLYKACASHCEGESDEIGLSEAHVVFQEAGGWPLLDNSPKDAWSPQTLVLLKKLGLEGNSLLDISLDTGFTNVTFVFRKPQMLLPTATLSRGLKEPQVADYLKYMRHMLGLFGVGPTTAVKEPNDILEFEISLAVMLETRSDINFSSVYTLAQLQSLPSMNWLPWDGLLSHSSSNEHTPVLNSTVVLVQDPAYIGQLQEFLQRKRESTILDYVMWRVAESLSPLVTRDLLNLYYRYRGQTINTYCRDLLSREMNVALSALYLGHMFNEESKLAAETIVKNVRVAIMNNLEDSHIDNAESKFPEKSITGIYWTVHSNGLAELTFDQLCQPKEIKHAVETVRSVVAHVAYPEQLLDTKLLQEYHRHLTMNASSFLRTTLEVARWRAKANKGFDWWMSWDITRAQATFSAQMRSVTVNAGLLQPPLFSPDLPAYVNYGTVGYLTAHHLSHASQLQGKKISQPETSIEYKGGLSHVFRAYKSQRAEEAGLPGLCQFNSQQLLLISMANLLCTRRPGRHAEVRVNAVMSQSPEFHQAFNCNGI